MKLMRHFLFLPCLVESTHANILSLASTSALLNLALSIQSLSAHLHQLSDQYDQLDFEALCPYSHLYGLLTPDLRVLLEPLRPTIAKRPKDGGNCTITGCKRAVIILLDTQHAIKQHYSAGMYLVAFSNFHNIHVTQF